MPCRRFRADIKTSQFPAANVLEDRGKRIRPFVAHEVLDHDRVLASGQSGEIKFCATGCQAVGAKDAAIKSAVRTGRGAGIQKERTADLRTRTGEGRFVVI